MQGAFEFEFIGDFLHQFYALWKVAVFRQVRKPPDFIPVHFELTTQGHAEFHVLFCPKPPVENSACEMRLLMNH